MRLDLTGDPEVVSVSVRRYDVMVQKVWMEPNRVRVRFVERRNRGKLFVDKICWRLLFQRVRARMMLAALGYDVTAPVVIDPVQMRGRYARVVLYCYRIRGRTRYSPIAYEHPDQPGSAVDDIRLRLFPPPEAH